MDHGTLFDRDVATEAQPPLYRVFFETKCIGISSQQAHTQHSIVKVWSTVVEEAEKQASHPATTRAVSVETSASMGDSVQSHLLQSGPL